MKWFSFLFSICLLMMTSACTKEELEIQTEQTSNVLTKSVVEKSVELSDVANLIARLDLSQEILDAIKQGVDRSLYYGQDENFRFRDMLYPESSKINRLSSSVLIDKMKEEMASINFAVDEKNLFDYLSDEDVQIYWPYSKKWDKKSNPVISYCDGNEDWCYGYKVTKQENGAYSIDTVIVDENYIENNTVWIISINNTNYDDLPNFEEGEFVKNGVFYHSDIAMKKTRGSEGFPLNEKSVSIGFLKCSDKFEGGTLGGPEIRFFWGHISENINNITAPIVGVNTLSINYSKSDINNEWKTINYNIQPYWGENAPENYLLVYEQDGGKDKTRYEELSIIGWNGEKYSAIVSFPYEKNDDILFANRIIRSEIFSEQNKPHGFWREFGNEEETFLFTLPNGL